MGWPPTRFRLAASVCACGRACFPDENNSIIATAPDCIASTHFAPHHLNAQVDIAAMSTPSSPPQSDKHPSSVPAPRQPAAAGDTPAASGTAPAPAPADPPAPAPVPVVDPVADVKHASPANLPTSPRPDAPLASSGSVAAVSATSASASASTPLTTAAPPSSQHPNKNQEQQHHPMASDSNRQETLAEGSKKKSRLQWDEENLMLNAAEMERAGPRMKIDEPKTPYNASETGSSASESVQHSPPESPSFISTDRLVGFGALEQNIGQSSKSPGPGGVSGNGTSSVGSGSGGGGGGSSGIGGGNVSDGASSVGSGGRSVHISDDNLGASAGSSPRSRELFASRRRAHYRNEARVVEWIRLNEMDEDDDDNNDNDDDDDDEENRVYNGAPNPEDVVRQVSDRLDSHSTHCKRPDSETNGYADL